MTCLLVHPRREDRITRRHKAESKVFHGAVRLRACVQGVAIHCWKQLRKSGKKTFGSDGSSWTGKLLCSFDMHKGVWHMPTRGVHIQVQSVKFLWKSGICGPSQVGFLEYRASLKKWRPKMAASQKEERYCSIFILMGEGGILLLYCQVCMFNKGFICSILHFNQYKNQAKFWLLASISFLAFSFRLTVKNQITFIVL